MFSSQERGPKTYPALSGIACMFSTMSAFREDKLAYRMRTERILAILDIGGGA
jgi:hypothetical protein